VDGVLLLHHHFPTANAPTIEEHVESFGRHSRYPVFSVNTDDGFAGALSDLRFKAILLHYSLFGGDYYHLSSRFRRYLERERDAGTYLVAFFQDEYRYCQKRFAFLRNLRVSSVYTLLAPEYHEVVYGAHASVADVRTTLPGRVSDQLIDTARRLFIPDAERTIDVGYRARRLDFVHGRGAQEKHEIAERFLARASAPGLRLDIDSREEGRIYGPAWYSFVANCRGMIGVEAGTSVFDLDDSAGERTAALLASEPGLLFDDIERRVLHEYEDRIYYRTLSPRHFEAAALRVTQILYRGQYSGVMEPDVHYLALEKDFSNFDDVMHRFADPAVRKQITDRAYDDLIASGRWSYASFVSEVDDHLAAAAGLSDSLSPDECDAIRLGTGRGSLRQRLLTRLRWSLRMLPFPGRSIVAVFYRRLRGALDSR